MNSQKLPIKPKKRNKFIDEKDKEKIAKYYKEIEEFNETNRKIILEKKNKCKYTLQFDSESRYKTVGIDLQLETNLPIFDVRTCVESSAIITKTDNNIGRMNNTKDEFYKARKYLDNGNLKTEETKSLGKARRQIGRAHV